MAAIGWFDRSTVMGNQTTLAAKTWGLMEQAQSHQMIAPGPAPYLLDLATTAAFKRNGRLAIDAGLHRRVIERGTPDGRPTWLHAAALAEHLFGNSQAMNTLMLGLAWQRGLVPISRAAADML